MRLAKATKAKHDSGLDNDSFMSLVWSNQEKENLDDETVAYVCDRTISILGPLLRNCSPAWW